MGRYIFVASIAMVACAGMASAKPQHAGHGNKPAWASTGDPVGYGAGGCPPGLRSKNPECMPPGQYKKQFEVGQRVPKGYDGLRSYNALPTAEENRQLDDAANLLDQAPASLENVDDSAVSEDNAEGSSTTF